MKKLIRLTESDLHRIVKESVNNILTELDWKTYASAANKASQKWFDAAAKTDKDRNAMRKYSKQEDAFDKASEDAFNKEYGTRKYKYYTDGILNANHAWDAVVKCPTKHRKVSSLSDDSWNESYFDYDPVNDESNGSWFENGDSHKGHSHYSEYPHHYDGFNDMEGDEILNAVGNQIDKVYTDRSHLDAAKRGNKELKDFHRGNYKYQKGKGWELKH